MCIASPEWKRHTHVIQKPVQTAHERLQTKTVQVENHVSALKRGPAHQDIAP